MRSPPSCLALGALLVGSTGCAARAPAPRAVTPVAQPLAVVMSAPGLDVSLGVTISSFEADAPFGGLDQWAREVDEDAFERALQVSVTPEVVGAALRRGVETGLCGDDCADGLGDLLVRVDLRTYGIVEDPVFGVPVYRLRGRVDVHDARTGESLFGQRVACSGFEVPGEAQVLAAVARGRIAGLPEAALVRQSVAHAVEGCGEQWARDVREQLDFDPSTSPADTPDAHVDNDGVVSQL